MGRPRTQRLIACLICGKEFLAHPSAILKGRRYCGRDCRYKAEMNQKETDFWPLVDIRGEDECWPFIGYRDPNGYGTFGSENRKHKAHRIAWELTYGELTSNEVVRHFVCDNPPCCNPKHLRKGSQSDNVADTVSKGRHARGLKHSLSLQGKSGILTRYQVKLIRHFYATDEFSHKDIANAMGVSKATVQSICARRNWGWLSEGEPEVAW